MGARLVRLHPLKSVAAAGGVRRGRLAGLTIRSRLALLVCACVLPVWFAAGFLVDYAYQAKRTLIEARMLETARALTLTVDQKLLSIQSALRVLATSPHLTTGDLAAFHTQAREVLKDYPEADIIMADAAGQQLINTYREFGEPLPRRSVSDIVRRVFESGRPAVTDLYRGAVTKRPLIGIDVPVLLNGKVAFDLAMALPAERLADILWQQHLPEGWLGVIVDSQGVVVARTLNPERFVGQRSRPRFRQRLSEVAEGSLEMLSFENVPQTFVFSRSATSGWAVTIGLPTESLWSEVHRWLWWTLSAAGLLSLLGLMLAVRMGRRIASSIQALAEPALALGRGKPVSIDSGTIRETEAVGRAMVEASRQLRQRSEERDRAEEELRASRDALKEAFDSLQSLNAELGEAKAAAESASRAKSAFIANISHELRTPLTSIIGFAEIIRDQSLGPVGTPVYTEYAADILSGGRQLKALVNDIIDLVKIESGKMEFAPIPMEVAAVARSVLWQVRDKAAERRIVLESRLAPDLPELWGDERAVKQILLNLLSNALKFTAEGGVVTLSAVAAADGVEITVADTGIGIPADCLAELMRPFQQVGARYTRSAGGAGLGLSLVRGLVDKHGGRVELRSVLGAGTEVTVFFPPHRCSPHC